METYFQKLPRIAGHPVYKPNHKSKKYVKFTLLEYQKKHAEMLQEQIQQT